VAVHSAGGRGDLHHHIVVVVFYLTRKEGGEREREKVLLLLFGADTRIISYQKGRQEREGRASNSKKS
jgi:hypothetical protein